MTTRSMKASPTPSRAAPWGNRIIGLRQVPAGQLLAHPANFRIHPHGQRSALEQVLATVGFVQGVIVNRRSDPAWGADRGVEVVLDGHLRALAALERGDDTPVPVVDVDLSPDEERLVLLTYDAIGAMAGRDREKYDALCREVLAEWAERIDMEAVLAHDRRLAKSLVSFEAATSFRLTVECVSREQRDDLAARLAREGYSYRLW